MPSPIEPTTERLHAYVQVNKAQIRREQHNGREHIVIPSYTLPDNVVMNGGLYTREEIDKHYKGLEGTLAPLAHPKKDGKFISAREPEALNANHIGAWNRNVERRGNRIYLEKWVDVETAQRHADGARLIARIEAFERGEDAPPIHTSVAAILSREPVANAKGYTWRARITEMDHDAILLDEPGAATPDQGVGLMVNVAESATLEANAGVLGADSYSNRSEILNVGARAIWGDDSWVTDFDGATAIVRKPDGETVAVGYRVEAGKAVYSEGQQSVKREESWVVNRLCQLLGLRVNSGPSIPDKPSPEADSMDKTELEALFKAQNEALQANVEAAIKPLGERLEKLETNQQALAEGLQAEAKAAEADKRKVVAAKLGDVVANALTGEALDAAFASVQGSAPLATAFTPNSSDKPQGVPKADEYFPPEGK